MPCLSPNDSKNIRLSLCAIYSERYRYIVSNIEDIQRQLESISFEDAHQFYVPAFPTSALKFSEAILHVNHKEQFNISTHFCKNEAILKIVNNILFNKEVNYVYVNYYKRILHYLDSILTYKEYANNYEKYLIYIFGLVYPLNKEIFGDTNLISSSIDTEFILLPTTKVLIENLIKQDEVIDTLIKLSI